MNFKINELQVLHILDALRQARRSAIWYYEEHTNEEERIGVIPPEEWEELYNTIIKQLHDQGELEILKPFKIKSKTSYKA